MDNQRQATETELAILAGFFAGEGYIGILKSTKKSKSPSLTVEVGNTERFWVEEFYRVFGGALRSSTPKRKNSLPYHKWYLKDEKAATFLREILPFLKGEKHNQALIAFELDAIKSCKPNRGRTGKLGHFNFNEIVAMERLEHKLRNLRCAAAETKRMGASPARSDSPILQVIAENMLGQASASI